MTAYAVHPGVVESEIVRHTPGGYILQAVWRRLQLSREVHGGAQTSLYCALDPELSHQSGMYSDICIHLRWNI